MRHVPTFDCNLLSLGALEEKGAEIVLRDARCTVYIDGEILCQGVRTGFMYVLTARAMPMETPVFYTRSEVAEVDLWHRRLGHIGLAPMKKLLNQLGIGVDWTHGKPIGDSEKCEICLKSRQTRRPSRDPMKRASRPLELIHMDIDGGSKSFIETLEYAMYFLLLTDDYTRYRWVYFLIRKSDATACIKAFIREVESQHSDMKVGRFRTDNAGELSKGETEIIAKACGITIETAVAYTPEQNGVAERSNRTILNRARALLFDSGLPHVLWNEAVETAVYLTNRSPTVAIEATKTPYEMRFQTPPKLDHLRLFGCKTFVHLVKEQRTSPSKLAERARVCYLCGYVGDHIYRVFDPVKVSVFKVRDVVFDETKLYEPVQQAAPIASPQAAGAGPSYAEWRKSQPSFRKTRMDMVLPPGSLLLADEENELDAPHTEPVRQEVGGSLPEVVMDEPGPSEAVIQAEPVQQDVGGSSTTGLDVSQPEPMHLDANSTEPAGGEGPSHGEPAEAHETARSLRPRRIHDYRKMHTRGLLSKDILQGLVSVPMEPVSYEEALGAPDHLQWELAMVEEISSLEANRTWDLVDIPKEVVPIKGKWVFKLKQGPSGRIERYKARWVAKGYLQRWGVDYEESFAPVAKAATVRVVLALTTVFDLDIEQIDVKTAFLNGILPDNESVYVEAPVGYQLLGKDTEGKCCKLLKGLYGLKQSARLWYKTAQTVFVKLGFRRSQADHCLFIKKGLWVLVYVDDQLIIGSQSKIRDFKRSFAEEFTITEIGTANFYLGMHIDRDRKERLMKVSQPLYAEKILEKVRMKEARTCKVPMEAGLVKVLRKNSDQATAVEIARYRSEIGSMMYIMTQTRPDLGYPIAKLSKYLSNPSSTHQKALTTAYRYLRGTADKGLVYGRNIDPKDPSTTQVYGYTDSDFASDPDTRKSTSGFVFMLAGAAVSWRSKQQEIVTKSSCEAEYVAVDSAASEAVWLRLLLSELGYPQNPTTIYVDNNGSIDLAHNPENHNRTKHIDVRFHYIRQLVENNEVELPWIETGKMLADTLTKPLGPAKFIQFRAQMGVD